MATIHTTKTLDLRAENAINIKPKRPSRADRSNGERRWTKIDYPSIPRHNRPIAAIWYFGQYGVLDVLEAVRADRFPLLRPPLQPREKIPLLKVLTGKADLAYNT